MSREWREGVALLLSLLLGAPAPAAAQNLVQQSENSLKVVVIQGEGAKNEIRSKRAVQPAVEVRDAKDQPVSGAEVVFELPWSGAGGTFHQWLRVQTTRTNNEGRAYAVGFAPNEVEGKFAIKVTATKGGQTGTAVINMENVAGDGPVLSNGRGSSKWLWIGLAGAAALGGGIYAATRNGNGAGSPVRNPITISAGPVTVGGPR